MSDKQNNQHNKGKPGALTKRKLLYLSPGELGRAKDLAKLYGGSVNQVFRAGLVALEREHAEENGARED